MFWESFPYLCDTPLVLVSRNETGHAISLPASFRNFQPLHSFHLFHPYTHPTYAALKRLLHLLSFLYVSCRLLTSSHTALFLHDSDNNPLPLPGPVTAASFPTRSRRFTPPGSRTGPGRSRATRFPPDRVGPTRSTVAHSAQAHSGSVPSTPVRPGPTRITGGSSARADSDPSVQSRHTTLTSAAPPDAPAGTSPSA